jgi:hypothetical protein
VKSHELFLNLSQSLLYKDLSFSYTFLWPGKRTGPFLITKELLYNGAVLTHLMALKLTEVSPILRTN